MKDTVIAVVGYKGEVGSAITELLEKAKYPVIGFEKDNEIANIGCTYEQFDKKEIDIMHVCVPYSTSFNTIVEHYIDRYSPNCIIIHSTVPVGTTKNLAKKYPSILMTHSPVRGVHPNMVKGLLTFDKMFAPFSKKVGDHLDSLGMRSVVYSSTDATELVKLLNTSYYGVMLAWTYEMENISKYFGVPWDEVHYFLLSTHQHIPRPVYTPPKDGIIGGHCVVDNSNILSEQYDSKFLSLVKERGEPNGGE